MTPKVTLTRREQITPGSGEPDLGGSPIRTYVSQAIGAQGFSTGKLELGSDGVYRGLHRFSAVYTVLAGQAAVDARDERYDLAPLDCIHIPAGVAYAIQDARASEPAVLHWAYASADGQAPARESGRGGRLNVVRFSDTPAYELSPGAMFTDLFAGRLGSEGICGGYGIFNPGSSLPCHTHEYDESITIVTGRASCLVQGARYSLANCDTAFVPTGRPHRFINESTEKMAMIWVYAGSEPERTIVDAAHCSGELIWPAPTA
jgi:mannose-6-phosphate isomerase-like protein (cupin superfamily)